MAFNSLCSSNDSNYLNEFNVSSNRKLQPLNLSYRTSSKLNKNTPTNNFFQKIDLYTKYEKSNFPYFIKLNAYSANISSKAEINLLILKNTSQKIKKHIILYLHDNNCDIGTELPFLLDLSIQLKLDCITFDYSNRGQKINVQTLYNDIDSVMHFINVQLNISSENLIIFGQGIGAIPAIYFASKSINLSKLILISPLFDGKNNFNLLKEINCKTYLIQEKKNKRIDYMKVSKICHLIKNEYEWFPNEETFQKVLENRRNKFFNKIKIFIQNLKSSFISSMNLSNDSNPTLSSSVKVAKNYSNEDDNQEEFYLHHSIYNHRKSNAFSDEEEVDEN